MGLDRVACFIAGLVLCLYSTATRFAAVGPWKRPSTSSPATWPSIRSRLTCTRRSRQPTASPLSIRNISLALTASIPLGVRPADVAVSRDGSKVYISNAGTSILTLDTSTNLLTTPVPIGHASSGVAIGNNNRIWILGNGIQQFDAMTGTSTGPAAPVLFTYSGKILTSPQGDRLYYATYGLSPGGLYQFDVWTSPAPNDPLHQPDRHR